MRRRGGKNDNDTASSADQSAEAENKKNRVMPEQPMLLLLHTVQDKIRHMPGSKSKMLSKMFTRSLVAMIMFVVAGLIYKAGHVIVGATMFALQVMVFKELLAVRYELNVEKKIPLFRTVVWLWFFVACFYSFGGTFMEELPFGLSTHPFDHFTVLSWKFGAAQIHEWLSFSLYVMAFCLTVLTLKKGHFQYQMQQLAWTMLTIILITMQSKSCIMNAYNGLFWAVFPASLVITNDVMAYFCGVFAGKKIFKGLPFLPDLSPNKTWEGFIGAGFFTVCAGFYLPVVWGQNRYMVCSYEDWTRDGESCHIPNVFVQREVLLWPLSAVLSNVPSIQVSDMQLHGMLLAVFASSVAPFGGFFASAIKRAFGIKDFGVLFPGHGGFTDRLDCQFLMALCTNVHYHTFIQSRVLPTMTIVSAIHAMQSRTSLEAIVAAANTQMEALTTAQ
eukprot:g1630.t1